MNDPRKEVSLGEAKLIVDEKWPVVFLEIPEFDKLLDAIRDQGSLQIVDEGQGTIEVIRARTNITQDGRYLIGGERRLLISTFQGE